MTAAVRPMPSGQRRVTWRTPALWLTIAALTYGLWKVTSVVYPAFVTYPHAAWLAIVLFGLYAVPFVLLFAGLDYLEREPISLTATAMAWGGLAATAVSAVSGKALKDIVAKLISPEFSDVWSKAIVAPTVEEPAKLLGIIVIVLLAKGQVNSVLDGVVYGAFAGIGFQLVENFLYAMRAVAVAGNGDSLPPVIATFVVRGFLSGLWSHTMFTALAGAGIGYALVAVSRPWWRRIGIALLAFAGAWLLHFVWNSPLLINGFGTGLLGVVAVLIVKGLPGLLLVAAMVNTARRSEAAYYSATLAGLDDPGLCTTGEIRTLCHARSRAAARRHAKARGGFKAAILVRRLQYAQARLAVALSRAAGSPAGTVYDHLSARFRDPAIAVERREQEVRTLRGKLLGLGISDAAAPVHHKGVHWTRLALTTVLVIAGSVLLAVIIRRLGGS
ncbi:PrsW family intramembrane metalloprotease [Longispora albida]|uniref:PrsW family intramembrane metalloprotease n=1 Tax=Longispora albida TaxID=203523 RepID=UPI00037017A2|nr:PrsW family intramembrane metalloprotease [Longispora albida]